jgi:cupin 2 domain-containing protein
MQHNLYTCLPSDKSQEVFQTIATHAKGRIERIVSNGQSSPEGFWYDQHETEWVVVLQGEAKILFQGEDQPIHLRSGDHVLIEPRRKHRVAWTSPSETTIWLAVFFA